MGFYGNISNINKSTFQFDKTYPNRYDMDRNANIDDIYVGRYILVDYDEGASLEALKTLAITESEIGDLYDSNAFPDTRKPLTVGYKRMIWLDEEQKYVDYEPLQFYSGKPSYDRENKIVDHSLLYNANTISDDSYLLMIGAIKEKIITRLDPDEIVEEEEPILDLNVTTTLYKVTVEGENVTYNQNIYDTNVIRDIFKNNYFINYNVDNRIYGGIGRGWDSTVWQKTYKDGEYKYVMIAELNSVVPTFDVTVDAPTQTPLNPHWDADNTNIYYKLHVQPSWGLRIKKAKEIIPETQADREKCYSTDTTQYPSDYFGPFYQDISLDDRTRTKKVSVEDTDLAIYWYEDGFNKYKVTQPVLNVNEIKIQPTGYSKKLYYNHEAIPPRYMPKFTPDTYELSMMLPEIGSTISKVWDIVYGKGAEIDAEGNALWDKDSAGSEWDFASETSLIRNTNLEWNTRNGERAYWRSKGYSESGQEYTYNKDALNTLAGVINSTHDLMGMIIVEKEINNIQNFNAQNLDPDKIYFNKKDNKYYFKDKKYEYIAGDDPGIHGYDMIDIRDSEEQYYKLSTLSYDNYDEIYKDGVAFTEYEYNNYEKVNPTDEIYEGAVYGTLVTHNENITTDKFNLEDDLYELTVKKVRLDNGVLQEYNLFTKKISGGPDRSEYYVLNNLTEISDKPTYYVKDKYYLGIKRGFNSPIEKSNWINRNEIYAEDFDNLSLRHEDSIAEVLTAMDLNNIDYRTGYKFLKGVALDPYASTYIYVDKNRKEEIIVESDEHLFYDELTRVRTYSAFGINSPLQNWQEIKAIVNDQEVIYLKYYASVYRDKNGHTVNNNELNTLKEWVESGIDSELLDLVIEEDLERVISEPVYTLKDAEIINLIDIENPNGTTDYYLYYNTLNQYHQLTKYDIGSDEALYSPWYRFDIEKRPIYYNLDRELYLDDGNGNYIRETASVLKYDDPNVNEDNTSNYKTVEWTPLTNKIVFVPNVYYFINDNGNYELAQTLDPNKTYYRYIGKYVVEDTNHIWEQGHIWNKDATKPDAVTLGYKTSSWILKEIPDFAKEMSTLHGLILKTNKMLLVNNELTRDQKTVQGSINTLNDIIDKFDVLIPAEPVMVDAYGRIHTGDWDSRQKFGYTNIGKPISSLPVPSGDPIAADNERWLKMTTTPGVLANDFKPHIKLEHTYNPINSTSTLANKNIDASSHGDGLNASGGDSIDLYTPIVDNTGHIVGNNTETVTLPYGFKTITTNGRLTDNDTIYGNTTAIAAQADIIADNTQDILGINSGNAWVKIETNANSDIITISHDVLNTVIETSTQDLSNETDGAVTFSVPTYEFDATNHFKHVDIKTITMPLSYGKFTGDKGVGSEASATHDTFSLTGDNWIETTATKDNIAFAHIGPVETAHVATSNETPAFGSTFTIVDWTFDDKGHKANNGTHTVMIPQGSLNITEGIDGANVITQLQFTPATGAIVGYNKLVGTLALTGYESLANTASLSSMPVATDSINSAIAKLSYVLDNNTTTVNTRISDLGGSASQTAGADGLALSVTTSGGEVTTINGSIAANTYDSYGSALTAETNAKSYADEVASTAEQNAKDYISTITFTYTTQKPNPDYPVDPDAPEYIDVSITKTIGEWIAYIMEKI